MKLNSLLTAFVASVFLTSVGSTVYAQTPLTKAVAFRQDPTHSGSTPYAGVAPPLVRRWSIDLGAPMSYPIIADGKVFVTYPHTDGYGTYLVALYGQTGAVAWGPVDLGGGYLWSGLAYDNGKVFTLDFDGNLRAFAAASGTRLWNMHLGSEYFVTSAPTAYDGVVYVAGGYAVWAVNARNGNVLWSALAGGSDTSPVVTDEAVYVAYECEAVALRRSDGSVLWRSSFGCSGGGGSVPVLDRGRVYASGHVGNVVLDAETGERLGSHPGGRTPSFVGTIGLFSRYGDDGTVVGIDAVDVTSGASRWTFAGDAELTTEPLVVDGFVYVASYSGQFYALDPEIGTVVWTENVGAPVRRVYGCCSEPWNGPSAGEGLLVVPAGTTLVAFTSAGDGSGYDRSAQDDTTGDLLEVNTTTGAYRLTECGTGMVTEGIGEVVRKGSCKLLFTSKDGARITATLNVCKNSGKVSVKIKSASRSFRIVDSNLANNSRQCQ